MRQRPSHRPVDGRPARDVDHPPYLHRKEPDIWNAKYWYHNCGKPYPGEMSFTEEAGIILNELS